MRIDRMLAITIMLLNRDKISAKELSDKFEVNVRTIYRDIDALNLAGIPVVSYPGNNGGFGIMENYKIDRQYLSLDDMSSILTALKSINNTLDDNGIDIAIKKIENLIPQNKRESLNETAVIDMLPWGVSDGIRDKLRDVHNACAENKIIKFKYTSQQSTVTSRTVEPMTIILKGTAWYLFAYCRERADFRIFKVTRMKDVEKLSETFVRRDATYKDYIDTKPATVTATVNLKLRFKKDFSGYVSGYFDESTVSVLENGDLCVNIDFPEDNWIAGWLLSFGDMVEVLEPVRYRTLLKTHAENILKIYQT